MKNGIRQIIHALGLTEDEYWTEYKLKENRDYLTYKNVTEYQDVNGIEKEKVSISDVKILKEKFLAKNISSTLISLK